jgi:hypothetical protein
MILGFKADLNKYSPVEGKEGQQNNEFRKREWCAKFNISFTQEKKTN